MINWEEYRLPDNCLDVKKAFLEYSKDREISHELGIAYIDLVASNCNVQSRQIAATVFATAFTISNLLNRLDLDLLNK